MEPVWVCACGRSTQMLKVDAQIQRQGRGACSPDATDDCNNTVAQHINIDETQLDAGIKELCARPLFQVCAESNTAVEYKQAM